MSSEDVATDVNQHLAEEQSAPVAQEKTFTQQDIDKAVQARLARERSSMGGMQNSQAQPGFDRNELLQEAAQMMQKQMDEQKAAMERDQQKAQVDEIAKTYLEKMALGKDLYDDFEEVTSDFSPGAYPQVTIMASQYGDVLPDIMYELSKNPRKLVDLHVLALTNPPQAKKEMAKLAQSIKKNEQEVANNSKSPTPLSRMKASATAGQDTGKRTVRDLRKDPKYRG